MTTASRKTATAAAVADGIGCGADTSVGLPGLSATRYDLTTSSYIYDKRIIYMNVYAYIIITVFQC